MNATTTPTIKCTFTPRTAYGTKCNQPAVSAVIVHRPVDGPQYQGRCKRHAAVDASRKYGALLIHNLDADVVAQITEREAAAKAAANEREAAQRIKRNEQHELARQRAWAESEALLVTLREDREGGIDWDATQAAKKADPEAAYVTAPASPRWVARGASYYEIEVTVERKADWPVKLQVRHSSEMTLRKAGALRDMLSLAIAAASEGGAE